jgi:hypothetical protein
MHEQGAQQQRPLPRRVGAHARLARGRSIARIHVDGAPSHEVLAALRESPEVLDVAVVAL